MCKDSELSVNQHQTAGKAGSRIDKRSGEIEKSAKVEKVRGALYNSLVVSEVFRETRMLSRKNTPLPVPKQLLQRMKNSHLSFQTVRTNATLTSYSQSLQSPVSIPNNAIVNATGFDPTDLMVDRFPYGKLRTVHLDLVRAEILSRGGEVDTTMKIRALGKYLLQLELEMQRKTYKERTGNDARDEDLNRNTFKPHHGTADFNALLQKD